jgi:hypothetical protein
MIGGLKINKKAHGTVHAQRFNMHTCKKKKKKKKEKGGHHLTICQ